MISNNDNFSNEPLMPEEKSAELIDAEKRRIERKELLFMKVMNIPEVEWLVEGIAVKGGITLLFGDAGKGKTSLMLQLIACTIEGNEFLGLLTEKVNTLLIEQDEGKPLLRSHVERMLAACPSLGELEVPTVWILWDNNTTDFQVRGSLLEELIDLSSASIVIIDSLTSLGITDINHPRSSIVFDRVRAISEKHHCAFILLHHPNKDDEIMGSNLIPAKVDCILHLQSSRLTFEKLRGKTPDIIVGEFGGHPYLDINQDPETLVFKVARKRSDVIQELIIQGKKRGEIITQIQQEYGGKKDSIGKAVDRTRIILEVRGMLPSNLPTRGFK
ncbi:AAA family ATPase [Chloroflexota bacterium]